MIKLIVAGMLVLVQATAAFSQKTTDPAKTEIKTTPVLKAPVRTQAPRSKTEKVSEPQAAATSPSQNSSLYYLASSKVTIYTGNDNKEQPSNVQLQMGLGAETISFNAERKEYAVNSATEITITPYYDRNYYPEKISLANTEKGGVILYIHYSPNILLDAWKIDKVVLNLEFKDDNGNLHPVMGSKSIQFVNVGGLLNDGHRTLVCEADQFLNPAKAYVRQ